MSDGEDSEKRALVLSSDKCGASLQQKTSMNESSGHERNKLLDNSKVNDPNDVLVTVAKASENNKAEPSQTGDSKEHTEDENTTSPDPCKVNSDINHESSTLTQVSQLESEQNMETPDNLPASSQDNDEITGQVIDTQPTGLSPLCPPQLESLLDCMQVVIHKGNLRHNIDISDTATAKYEIIDETRRVLFYVEKEPPPLTEQSFRFRMYDKHKQPAIEVYNPLSRTCFMCHSSWHCLKKFKFQAVILAPPGMVAGFVRRSNTCLLQEYEILSPQEDLLLVMRGGPYDLEIYSTDLDTGLGRMAVRGWHGIMHEVKRSGDDIGLTFPLDLDVRVKAVLLGAVFAIDWLYDTRNGTRS